MSTKTTKKKTKRVSKVRYIVTWDNEDGDPVAVFKTLPRAKEFITKIITTTNYIEMDELNETIDPENVDKESVRLYKGELIGQPIVQVDFKIKE